MGNWSKNIISTIHHKRKTSSNQFIEKKVVLISYFCFSRHSVTYLQLQSSILYFANFPLYFFRFQLWFSILIWNLMYTRSISLFHSHLLYSHSLFAPILPWKFFQAPKFASQRFCKSSRWTFKAGLKILENWIKAQ